MKRGLLELAVVTALLVLAAAGALVLRGDEIRAWLGPRPAAAPVAPAPPAR